MHTRTQLLCWGAVSVFLLYKLNLVPNDHNSFSDWTAKGSRNRLYLKFSTRRQRCGPSMSATASNPESGERHVEYTIDLLNGKLVSGTIAPDELIKLYQLCMSRKKKAIAHLCVVTGMFLCANSSLTFQQTLEVALCGACPIIVLKCICIYDLK